MHKLFSIVVDYCSYRLLNKKQMILLQHAQCIHDNKERVVGLPWTLVNFTEVKQLCYWPS